MKAADRVGKLLFWRRRLQRVRLQGRRAASMPTPTATRHAAFASIDWKTVNGNLRIKQGIIAKHPRNPLFIQSEPWERRIDNGYPNVVKLPTRGSSFQLWYGTCARENNCDRQLLLYANSTDGLRWRKPRLGLFDLAAADLPELRAYGRANNILVEAGGVGVFRDEREPNPSLRYKAIGPGCWTSPTLSRVGDVDACGGGAPLLRCWCCRRPSSLLPSSAAPPQPGPLRRPARLVTRWSYLVTCCQPLVAAASQMGYSSERLS